MIVHDRVLPEEALALAMADLMEKTNTVDAQNLVARLPQLVAEVVIHLIDEKGFVEAANLTPHGSIHEVGTGYAATNNLRRLLIFGIRSNFGGAVVVINVSIEAAKRGNAPRNQQLSE